MSRVETIEQEVKALSSQELADFREWFLHFDADAWNRQIAADTKAGKLESLAEQALANHSAGKSREI